MVSILLVYAVSRFSFLGSLTFSQKVQSGVRESGSSTSRVGWCPSCLCVRWQVDGMDQEEMRVTLRRYDMKSPITNNDLSDPLEFNLMFSTSIGPTGAVKGCVPPTQCPLDPEPAPSVPYTPHQQPVSNTPFTFFYVGSIWDDSRLHAARSYTSSPDGPFSLRSSFTQSAHLFFSPPLLLPCTSISITLLPTYSSSLLTTCPYHRILRSWTFFEISPT